MLTSSQFPCSMRDPSPTIPYSVHRLRPADIKVVAGLGDSITAGVGALAPGVLEIANQYQGVSFDMGGDRSWREYLTLPNILKVFNPKLRGYSRGVKSGAPLRIRNRRKKKSYHWISYNFADTGADSDDVIVQARRLVSRMKRDPHVDLERDWKLVTVLVGHNDICSHSCQRTDLFESIKDATPKAYARNVAKALDLLHQALPRTMVNVLAIADITEILEIHQKPLPCYLTHAYGCPCLFDPKFSKRLSKRQILNLLNGYLHELESLINSGRYDTRQDFTVVLQPTLIQGNLPRHRPYRGAKNQINVDYLAPDCFHWAQKTHALASRAYWNNLLEPVGMKTSRFTRNSPFLCPTEEFPFLSTNLNSDSRTLSSMDGLTRDFQQMVQDQGGPVTCPL